MYIDLVMKPIKEQYGQTLTWYDNCGSHKTATIEAILNEHNLDTALLAVNMTDLQQPMELVVNAQVKCHLRTIRAMCIVDYFNEYKSQLVPNQQPAPFKPPKPLMTECIQDLINLMENQFRTPEFAAGIHRCFQDVGMIPRDDGTWSEYRQEMVAGVMKFKSSGSLDASMLERDDDLAVQNVLVQNVVNNYLRSGGG